MNKRHVLSAATALVLSACAALAPTPRYADRTHPVPADYRSWPRFLPDVDRADARQVRAIFVNPTGYAAKAGEPFPSGSVSVMEIYKARENADGSLVKDGSGRLVRGDLLKIFVMGKGPGWGDDVKPAELRNGDWVYAAYLPDLKTAAPDDIATCRACHLPLAAKDYVPRYDEFFQKRAAK